jgi:23S rRNA (adenine2030-N6)-methyltransferase
VNYRHEFHAGGFQDVVKHAALTRLIERLKAKDKPFVVLDSHAGAGRYDLAGEAAQRTREYERGIARVLRLDHPPRALKAYLAIVRAMNREGPALRWYPGSPAFARAMLREDDRMVFVESVAEIARVLSGGIAGDRRARVMTMDGYTALKALLPPAERRGLIVIDPPFEVDDEFARIEAGLKAALRRFATGIYLIWYPVKDPAALAAFRAGLAGIAPPGRAIDCQLIVAADDAPGLRGCGVIVVNPPWRFESDFAALLDDLARVLAPGIGRASLSTLGAEVVA